MSSKLFVFLGLVVMSVLLVGCTAFQATLTADDSSLPASNPDNIKVYLASETPTHSFKEIGYIVATKSDEEEAVKFLKEKAGEMGADALTRCEVRVHTAVIVIIFIPIPVHSYIANAVAVKYTN